MTPANEGAFSNAQFLSEFVRYYIFKSQEMGMSAVEAAYNANAAAEDLDTIQNWGDAEAVVFMTLHQRMHWEARTMHDGFQPHFHGGTATIKSSSSIQKSPIRWGKTIAAA